MSDKLENHLFSVENLLGEDTLNDETLKNADDRLDWHLSKIEQLLAEKVPSSAGGSGSLTYRVVNELPESGEAGVIYFLPVSTTKKKNIYDEYIWVNNDFEKIGSTDIDLANYATKEFVQEEIEDIELTPGPTGKDGGYYIPNIADDGLLSWIPSNSETMPTVEDVNIKGPQGVPGEQGETGASGADGLTPFINAGGNWQIGETDTEIRAAGVDGESISITSIVESEESGGNNILTFSDGKQLIIKNGTKGQEGDTPQKGVDYFDGISATHSWDGTTLTITSASGTSSADLKGDKGDAFTYSDFTSEQLAALKGEKGDKGDKGDTGEQGPTGPQGESGVYTGEGEPPESAAIWLDLDEEEVFLVKSVNGATPDKQGNIEIKDVLTEADKTEIAQETSELIDTSGFLLKNQGTANVGKILIVGTDGNLTLTDMPEGGASGDVTGVLDGNNNIILSGNLSDGKYTLKYENDDGTYTVIGTLDVGEIIPEPTNLFIIGGDGYILNGRCNSEGKDRTDTNGNIVTNYIDIKNGDTIYIKNATLQNSSTVGSYSCMKLTDSSVVGFYPDTTEHITNLSTSNGVTQFTINNENADYVRLCLNISYGTATTNDIVVSKGIIITVNEPLS